MEGKVSTSMKETIFSCHSPTEVSVERKKMECCPLGGRKEGGRLGLAYSYALRSAFFLFSFNL